MRMFDAVYNALSGPTYSLEVGNQGFRRGKPLQLNAGLADRVSAIYLFQAIVAIEETRTTRMAGCAFGWSLRLAAPPYGKHNPPTEVHQLFRKADRPWRRND